MSLQEALASAYWYKEDLRTFLLHALSDRSVLPLLDWRDRKRAIVAALVGILARGPAPYVEQLRQLSQGVAAIEDFTHLQRLDGGEEKVRHARESIVAFRRALRQLSDAAIGQPEPEGERRDSHPIRSGVTEGLAPLRDDFLQALWEVEPHLRGERFLRLTSEVFALFDFEGNSFRHVGETIEGKFTLEGVTCHFEGRWTGQTRFADVLAVGERLWRGPAQAMGLLLSMEGFLPDATRALWDRRWPLILVDGQDLIAVLEGLIDLPRLLLRKKRHFIDAGDTFLPVAKILAGS